MNFIQTVILSLVQGFTEWLPVSSSGHLVIAENLMGLSTPVGFYAILHVGTLLAVIVFFWRDIKEILKSLFSFKVKDENFKFFLYVLIGTVPTAIIALLFLKFFESLFSTTRAVGIGFLITGFFLLLSKLKKDNKKLNWLSSLLIGTAQGISIVPGISRIGSTMSTGLASGISKKEVFKYCFLLSIPTMIGWSILEYKGLIQSGLGAYSFIGMLISAISGYIAIKIVHKIFSYEKFYLFAIYCFLAGLLVLTLL